ncbi:MAG: sulfur reduction protein DsrJ [Gammaproteobacteria bacterium]|nr:sulfur reduction protein DsrJ [Gammaproteobacteria bacterium]
MTRRARRRLMMAAAATATAALAAFSGAAADGHLMPPLPEAKGEQCVEPTEVMRRRHAQFILHQRDETVHRGIRTQKHRFVNCIDCHVRPNAAGAWPRHTDDGHFCSVCHRYASVQMDCFQCHADRPPEAYAAGRQSARKTPTRLGINDLHLERLR